MLRTRILTGFVLGFVVVGTILGLPTVPAAFVFGAIWLIGAGEWARLAGLGHAGRVVYGALFATLVTGILGFGLPPAAAQALLWLAVACWLIVFVYVLRFPAPLARLPILIGGFFVLPAAWLAFYLLHGTGSQGPALVLAGLIVVWSADIGAYFAGRTFGRVPLAPRVSPKKTWEGVVGGLVLAAAAGIAAAAVLGLPYRVLAPLAVVVALVSVVGDLGISMLKRRAGYKDAGVLLPGHGGVLDRFDGVTAALPVFVLGLQFAHVLD